jgi:hypothetical protein
MKDDVLRVLVETIESEQATCPVALYLGNGVLCGLAVSRAVFFETLEETATKTERLLLKRVAQAAAKCEDVPGTFLHLIEADFLTGGRSLEPALSSRDRERPSTVAPPVRVPIEEVGVWHAGSLRFGT